ncbi:hypothetical protein BKA69DRAFT_385023 [Paraphysoderma sedebokerense]|nr:hypothetical protein BKA69DRAFT_385023 [Paraphysoderma sedebokerense]
MCNPWDHVKRQFHRSIVTPSEDIEASTNKTNVIRLQNENAELKVEIERLKGILATGVHIDASDTSSESPFDIISKYYEEAQAKLEQRAADFQLRMETVSTALQSRENELERSIIEFAKTKSYLTSLFEDNSKPRAVIHLNVGGTRYSIPKQTLCNSPHEKSEHMFVNMFNERWEVKYDESGTVFVDGNGRLFEYIVQWLRHGIVPQALSDDDRKALVLDSEYCMMDEFKARLTTGSKARSPLLIKPK